MCNALQDFSQWRSELGPCRGDDWVECVLKKRRSGGKDLTKTAYKHGNYSN